MGICFFLVISVENNNISRAERKPDVTRVMLAYFSILLESVLMLLLLFCVIFRYCCYFVLYLDTVVILCYM